MTLSLQQQLDLLNEKHTAEAQATNANLTELSYKRQSLEKLLEQLGADLMQADKEFQQLQNALESSSERFKQQSIEPLLVSALAQSQKDLYECINTFRLRQERSARPQRGKKIPSLDPLKLILVMISNSQDDQISWVIPLPPTIDAYPAENADLLEEFSELCIHVILQLDQSNDWYFAGMGDETTAWQGFATQTTLMQYSGRRPMVVCAEEILQHHFDILMSSNRSGSFQNLPIVVEVALVPQESGVWIGRQTEAAEPAPEEVPVESSIPLFERSLGWYKDDDVAAWNRPLRVTEDSAWTVQGRCLRTALIGLIARGHLGSDYVAQRYLWQALPSPHQEAMREGINRLLEHSLLQTAGDPGHNGEMLVAVNPEMIERVQALINRQVDESWQSLINL